MDDMTNDQSVPAAAPMEPAAPATEPTDMPAAPEAPATDAPAA